MSNHELRIRRIKAEGLRCPNYELDFENPTSKQVHPITLVMMPNGTGKTTTLNCLRAIFSGEANRWAPEKVRSFKKERVESRNGEFSVELSYRQKTITVLLKFDFFSGSAEYFTTRGSGQQPGHNLPNALKVILTKEFTRLFVFDGEEANNLLSPEFTKANQAIESLFKLSNFKLIENVTQDFFEEETKNATAKTVRGVKSRIKALGTYRAKLAQLESQSTSLEASILATKEHIKSNRELFGEKLDDHNELKEEIERVEADLKAATVRVAEKRTAVLRDSHNPLALIESFSQRVLLLRDCLDRAKLPENTSREFFEELANEDTCVCGRSIDPARSEIIKERASLYLGSDDVSVLNNIKSDISSSIDHGQDPIITRWQSTVKEMVEAIGEKNTCRTDSDLFKSRIENENPELSSAQEEFFRLQLELEEKEKQLESVTSTHHVFDKTLNADQVTSVHQAERLVKHFEQLVQDQLGTVELASRVELLKKIVSRAHAIARDSLSDQMTQETNETVTRLLPANRLRVDSIGDCIRLDGKEAGSVGETLCIGYAFLQALFQRAENHSLPFIVDYPTGSLDNASRENLGELVPKLSKQFIGFVISSERVGFVNSLEEAADVDIQFLTMFRKTHGTMKLGIDVPTGSLETADGVVVESRDFFYGFQDDQSGEGK